MSTTPRKVCVVTGTRAEYGLLRWVMEGIKDSELLELQLIVTGMHLSPEFGLTVRDIEADGFRIDSKVFKNRHILNVVFRHALISSPFFDHSIRIAYNLINRS